MGVPVLFLKIAPSIAAFEEGAGCGARQWHRGGAPGGAGPYVTGPARPKAATPGDRGPAVARAEPRFWVRQPAAIRRWRLPALHSPLGETEKGKRRAGPGARIQSQGSRSYGRIRSRGNEITCERTWCNAGCVLALPAARANRIWRNSGGASPPPHAGEGVGRGHATNTVAEAAPSPNPPPQAGEGVHRLGSAICDYLALAARVETARVADEFNPSAQRPAA